MENENIEQKTSESEQQTVGQDNSNYIEALKEMREKSVPRAEYEKLEKENKQLLQSLVNGEPGPTEQQQAEPVNIDELRKDLFTKPMTNMEYIQKALELRNQLIETQGIDIFVGSGKNFVPTNEDYETAQKVADAFQSCIEIADGNPEVFNRELQRITIDSSPQKGRINDKIRR